MFFLVAFTTFSEPGHCGLLLFQLSYSKQCCQSDQLIYTILKKSGPFFLYAKSKQLKLYIDYTNIFNTLL